MTGYIEVYFESVSVGTYFAVRHMISGEFVSYFKKYGTVIKKIDTKSLCLE